MRILHQKLHLQHHRHTGRLLHHKHTSYRGLAVVLVLAGVFMVAFTMVARATADSLIYVYARIPAPIPTGAPVITDPVDGTTVIKPVIPVSGTCPIVSPSVIIGLLSNGSLVGSTPCEADGTFSLSIPVARGEQTLIARVYTITNDQGLDSNAVRINYVTPNVVGANDSESGTAEYAAGPPLVLTIDEPFIIFGPAKDAIWRGTITGGTLPYHVHIDWGDGKSSDYVITRAGQQAFSHHYSVMDPHIINFHVRDSAGRGISRTYAAVTPYVSPLGNTTRPIGPLPFQGSKPLGIYGIYLLLLAVFGYLWTHAGSFAYAKATTSHRPRQIAAKRKHQVNGRH